MKMLKYEADYNNKLLKKLGETLWSGEERVLLHSLPEQSYRGSGITELCKSYARAQNKATIVTDHSFTSSDKKIFITSPVGLRGIEHNIIVLDGVHYDSYLELVRIFSHRVKIVGHVYLPQGAIIEANVQNDDIKLHF